MVSAHLLLSLFLSFFLPPSLSSLSLSPSLSLLSPFLSISPSLSLSLSLSRALLVLVSRQ